MRRGGTVLVHDQPTERGSATRSRAPAPLDKPARDAPKAGTPRVLELSQLAGNRAVTALVAGRLSRSVRRRLLHDRPPKARDAADVPLQRWGADEHRRLGDTTGLRIDIGGGVELTFGQIVALAGDEFGSEEELLRATETADGRAMIRAHLERAELPGPVRGSLPVPDDDQRGRASTEYVKLAMDNSAHFVGGGTAVEEWTEGHARAVDKAMQAGLARDPSLMNGARFSEAFAHHFLTDAFSSGHIRVPRQEITDHYVGEIAPRVYDHLVDFLRDRLVDELYDQVEQQTVANEAAWIIGGPIGGLGVRAYMRRKIRDAVNEKLDGALAAVGGRAEAVRYLGLGLAGLVAGAMHDAENRDGLMVISDVHPDPWRAFGDGKLDDSAKHKQQVEAAVAASVADLDVAYEIGAEQHDHVFNLPDPTWLPKSVHFAFARWDEAATTVEPIEMVAHFMRYHPSTVVTLTGHTDPIGKPGDNDVLGENRAATVRDVLIANGVDAGRINTGSMGERALVTRNPRRYAANRRVTFSFATDASLVATDSSAQDVAEQKAKDAVAARVGPPYAAERHFPRAAPGLNAPLPSWRWGAIRDPLKKEMNDWAGHYIKEYKPKIAGAKDLDPITVDDYTVSPRPIVLELLGEIERDPVRFLGRALGRAAG